MVIRRYLLVESDHRTSTLAVRSRHITARGARRAMLRRMAEVGQRTDDPRERYGWQVSPYVRVPRIGRY